MEIKILVYKGDRVGSGRNGDIRSGFSTQNRHKIALLIQPLNQDSAGMKHRRTLRLELVQDRVGRGQLDRLVPFHQCRMKLC